MRSGLRRLHAIAAWLLVAGIVIQVFLAGSAIAVLGGTGNFSTHVEFGYTAIGLLALAVVLTAVAARSARQDVGASFGLLLLYVVQTALPQFRASMPAIAALHPVNAMLVFGLAAWYARRAWRRAGADPADGGPVEAASPPTRE